MKIFVFGGYGNVGLPAIQLLAGIDLITEIAVAGRNLEHAEKAAAEIGEKAIAVHADGTDEQELTALLAGYDIIVNAASGDVVVPAIRAAARTSTNYCDVASFGDFVEEVLQLAPEAKAAGITAIIAAGISPCISNLMGIHVARQFEEVQQLQLIRAEFIDFAGGRDLTPRQWRDEPQQSLNVLHQFRPFVTMMLQILQKNGIRTMLDYKDGHWVEEDPIRSGLDVPYLERGTTTAYPYVSCDSFWGALPRDIGKVAPVEVYFSPLPPQLHAVLRDQALRVLKEYIDPETGVNSFYDTADDDPRRWLTLPDDYTPVPKMGVRAVGYKDGRAARNSCWFTGPMWDVGGYFLTSVALVVAVCKILRGEIQQRGIMTAETAFEPLSFLQEVASTLPEPLLEGALFEESFEWLV